MAILRGLSSHLLRCGCLVGVYETYDGNVVTILDARGDRCANEAHVSDHPIAVSPEDVPGANHTGNPAARESEQ
jgi:hypothetical protein